MSEELKRLANQPRCSCGGQCYPLANHVTERGGVIVRRQCRKCANVMWQLQKIEALGEITNSHQTSEKHKTSKKIQKNMLQ
jgi:hypothetical protein